MPRRHVFCFRRLQALAACSVVVTAADARADAPPVSASPRPHAYAVVVGSNMGGGGQQPLHFAEDDAQRMAQVLRELGHFEAGDVRVLLHPNVSQVLGALDDLAARARAEASRGEQTEVVFYYSGHARATAINLGGEELPLTTLRDRLGGLPTALTIVVLDACQSGAFARIKGAEPAADFTYNSVSRLTQKGLAIMASSSPQELSQESDELRGSYFTHHLVTGLRGAGDADGDGRVSLDEAYRYAYRRTLASTARTQVGEQHVTLETDLAGQGEVPVTYPADARSQLELPGSLEARILVQRRPSGSVVAEVQKAPGAAIRLALVAGSYDVVVGTLVFGEKCADSTECASGLTCTGAASDPLCSQCSASAPCTSGVACSARSVFLPSQCGPGEGLGKAGDPCLNGSDCASGACAGATPVALADEAGVCDLDAALGSDADADNCRWYGARGGLCQ
jgi:hypothetical protein